MEAVLPYEDCFIYCRSYKTTINFTSVIYEYCSYYAAAQTFIDKNKQTIVFN